MPLLWLQRWYYLHALLRLDLNALMLDADVVLFRDPYGTRLGRGTSHTRTAPQLTRSCRYRYPYLKGAFANVTMIANFDRSTPAPGKVNGGVWYFQRAAADGPVVALLADFVGRTLALVAHGRVRRAGRLRRASVRGHVARLGDISRARRAPPS